MSGAVVVASLTSVFPECSQVHVSRSPKLQCCRRTETQARSQNQKINTRSQKPHVPMQLKRNTRACSRLSRHQPGASPHSRPRGPAHRLPAAHRDAALALAVLGMGAAAGEPVYRCRETVPTPSQALLPASSSLQGLREDGELSRRTWGLLAVSPHHCLAQATHRSTFSKGLAGF